MGNIKPRKYKLDGRRFGHLSVREYAGNSRWICDCDCGKSCEILTGRLVGGHVKSCGCKGKQKQTSMLKPYVFECLKRYGNTVIGEQTFQKYGEKAILKELSKHGFKCNIRILIHEDVKNGQYDMQPVEKYIIVEIIR